MKRPLMLPLVPFYAAGLALRETRLQRGWEQVRRLRYPVISIGNLSTGGSGKTPLTIALARLLSAHGFQVDVLSRGYGRRSAAPRRVDPNGSADEFGDEPLLIAREAGVPVYVAPERYDAGQLAEADWSRREKGPADELPDFVNDENATTRKSSVTGHDFSRAEAQLNNPGALAPASPHIHILDDGFQHRQLARDIDILLVNREDWHDHLLPAGNLREPAQAARRASVLAIPSEDPAFEHELRVWGWTGPIWRIRRRIEIPPTDGPVAAFCGIARPEQFFAGLEAAGLRVAAKKAFADHHRYSPRDIVTLLAKARAVGAVAVVTTEKDQARMGRLLIDLSARLPLRLVRLTSRLDDEPNAAAWLNQKLTSERRNSPFLRLKW
jgi:tetraacyldisaccharide 4'-kinase